MTTIALKQETDNYWLLIKDAGNEVKLALIKRLSDALRSVVNDSKKRRKKLNAEDYAGIWSDEDYMDANKIVDYIREARHINSSRDELWDER